MKRIVYCSLLAACLAVRPLRGEEMLVHVEPAATRVEFSVGGTLHTVHGTFRLKRGEIHFDPAGGTAGGELVVDAQSGDSGSGARDGRMHKSILETGKYPEIVFVPDHVLGTVHLQGDSEVQLHGALTIHGVAHELTVAAKTHIEQHRLTAVIDFPVPYVSWGMKNPSTLFLRVDDTVKIEIQAVGEIAPASRAGTF